MIYWSNKYLNNKYLYFNHDFVSYHEVNQDCLRCITASVYDNILIWLYYIIDNIMHELIWPRKYKYWRMKCERIFAHSGRLMHRTFFSFFTPMYKCMISISKMKKRNFLPENYSQYLSKTFFFSIEKLCIDRELSET